MILLSKALTQPAYQDMLINAGRCQRPLQKNYSLPEKRHQKLRLLPRTVPGKADAMPLHQS